MPEDLQMDLLRDALIADSPDGPDAQRVADLRARVASLQEADEERIGDAPRRPAVTHWAMAAAAAIVIVVAGVVVVDRVTDRSTSEVAGGTVEFEGPVGSSDGASGDLTVTMVETGRVVEFQTDDLAILPKGEFYEFWFVAPGDGSDGPTRISAGTFHPDADGRSDITLTVAADPERFSTVEVSAEIGPGDPRAPGPVVLTADLSG